MSKKKNRATKAVPTRDSFQNPLSRTGVFMPNLMEATQYPLTRFTRDWQTINSLYRSHWVVRRIIDCIPEDMIKSGYKILSQVAPDSIKQVITCDRTTHTSRKILEGLKWGRLYGGAGGLIMVDGQEDMLDRPLDLDMVMPGSYKGLLILDRWSGITPNDDLVKDPSDPEFGLPDSYTITCDVLPIGVKVHHSRIVRFMGRPLPYLEQLAETYWGASEIEHIFDELRKRDNVSWNIAMLTFMANLRVMKLEGMGQILAVGNQQAQEDLYNTMQAMNSMMNNNSIQILGENDSYESHQYTFGGIGETYDRFMMDLAGAAETPVTKLFGRSPAGLNSTGEGDMQNYYDTIEEKQENELRPAYDKLLPIMFVSSLGGVPDDMDYEFNPVRRAPESEMADLASKNTDSVTKAFQAGLISQRTALKELRQQSELTGMWSNITDDDIERADEEVMDPNEGMGDMGAGGFGDMEDGGNGPMGDNGSGGGGDNEPQDSVNSTRSHEKEKGVQVSQEDKKGAQTERQEVSATTTDAAYPKDPNPKNWRTINGSKVHLTKGKIDGGAGGKFTGKKWKGKQHHEFTPGASKQYVAPKGEKFSPKVQSYLDQIEQIVAQSQKGNGKPTYYQSKIDKAEQQIGALEKVEGLYAKKNPSPTTGAAVKAAKTQTKQTTSIKKAKNADVYSFKNTGIKAADDTVLPMTSKRELNNFGNKYGTPELAKLPRPEYAAIVRYTHGSGHTRDWIVYGQTRPWFSDSTYPHGMVGPAIQRTVDNISKGLKKMKHPNMFVVRKAGLMDWANQKNPRGATYNDLVAMQKKGTVFTNEAFLSTTMDDNVRKDPAAGYGDKEVCRILYVPKKAVGGYVAPAAWHPDQYEFLLDKGAKTRIMKVEKGKDGRIYTYEEVVLK